MLSKELIKGAKTKKALDWLERKNKKDRDEIINNPNYKQSIKVKANKRYLKNLKLIRRMRRRIRN